MEDSGSIGIITLPQFSEKVEGAKKLIETRNKADFPLKMIILKYDNTSNMPNGAIDYKELISDQVDTYQNVKNYRNVDDIALLPYSSGTTGLSKGVQLTHRNCLSNFLQIDNPDQTHFSKTSSNYLQILLFFLIPTVNSYQ